MLSVPASRAAWVAGREPAREPMDERVVCMRGLDERDIAFTRRRLSAEHMDDPAICRADLAESLVFIRAVNRRLGGTAAALKHINRWSKTWRAGETIRMLDVGTGSADIPLAIARWARHAGHRIEITAVDRHPVTLELAKEYIRSEAGELAECITFIEADALELHERFTLPSFDYAHAGMFLHHLPNIEVMTALRIMDRLTTRGLIWNDLARGSVERLFVRALTARIPQTVRHDARVSVEAGFTKREALVLAHRVGLEAPRWHRHLFGRFTLTSEKPAGGS